jgi:hypothetical protein
MRGFQLLGAALVAVFAFGVLAAAASAAPTFLLAEWLLNGHPVVSELLVEISGELLLEDTKVPIIGKSMILCDGIGVGWVGPNSLGWGSELLSLAGVVISNVDLSGTSLDCTAQTGCETNTAVLVWPFGSEKEAVLDLMEETGQEPLFVVLGFGNIGWHITECLVFGVPQEDLCVAEPPVAGAASAVAQLTLEGTTLLASISRSLAELAELKLATCTQGGTGSGVVEGSAPVTLDAAEELTASSDELVA